MDFHYLIIEIREKIALIRLHRPKYFNALNDALMAELAQASAMLDKRPDISCLILTGNDHAFAAGADIRAMADLGYMQAYQENYISNHWECIQKLRKPIIAAVAGLALGGGCELAMACDIVLAADNAEFAQPEITLGILPGAGATQRLPRAIGKSKAMEMCLTAQRLSATDAEKAGMISRVLPLEKLLPEAWAVATKIASLPLHLAMMIKTAINHAYETPLQAGLQFERQLFHSIFATDDQKEGMHAFLEKRSPQFKNQ